MLKRLPYSKASDELRQLISELSEDGDSLVLEDEEKQPIACITPLSDLDKPRRLEGARGLQKLLAEVPPSSYSEEETYNLIDEAISAIRAQDTKQHA